MVILATKNHERRKLDRNAGRHLLRIIVPISAPLIICYLENWPWYDGIYYTVISGTTIGLGDLTPTKKFSKIAAIAFKMTNASRLL